MLLQHKHPPTFVPNNSEICKPQSHRASSTSHPTTIFATLSLGIYLHRRRAKSNNWIDDDNATIVIVLRVTNAVLLSSMYPVGPTSRSPYVRREKLLST